jgi:hypothetical protein
LHANTVEQCRDKKEHGILARRFDTISEGYATNAPWSINSQYSGRCGFQLRLKLS